MPNAKPTAIVFAQPYEGRIGYFLAGLSHYYRLKIYYVTNKRFRFRWQFFYRWQYGKDCEFIKCESLDFFAHQKEEFNAAFIQEEAVAAFSKRYQNQAEVINLLKKIRPRVKQLFWLELGEQSYFTCGGRDFWDTVDFVLKGQLFKKQYEYFLKDRKKMALFHGRDVLEAGALIRENENFNIDVYRHKILPFPFTPSITEAADLDFSRVKKFYDIAANTRTWGNGALRCSIIRLIQKNLPKEYIYSFDYDEQGRATNLPRANRLFDFYLIPGKWGRRLFRFSKYGKYFYPGPLYLHNLSASKCYLGLGWTFSSLRTADCWGAGVVLVNFSFAKCEYGIPLEDGVHYVSIGERDEMTDDNLTLKPEYENQIMKKIKAILSDPEKQAEIINNQRQIYNEYFASPARFVKKILIEKI